MRVIPRAGRNEIAGTRGDALLVRLSAAPVDGAANDALIALLADTFDVPKHTVSIVAGHRSRQKRVSIAGVDPARIAVRIETLIP